ncbi:hypothetical protein [Bradyrhizobium monzae]|uniref:hypothetical protein n=1 Tax=Bradyrhizobium sp. Oc8 TaxID=2876780 RepID=UPI001F2AA1C6|nr:hypothetical protein [Bradyrhizobium sp. Oc8]
MLRSCRPWPIGITISDIGSPAAGDLASRASSDAAPCGDLLTLEIRVLDGSFRWHFDASRLASTQIERMMTHLNNLLHAVMADTGQPLGRLALLSGEEHLPLGGTEPNS